MLAFPPRLCYPLRTSKPEYVVMLKEHDPPKEPARRKAERRWKNAGMRARIKKAQQKPQLVDPNKEPDIGEVVTNAGRRDSQRNRFETKFVREIRRMMEGHVNKNLAAYAVSLEYRRYRLLKEKLRRLQAAQQPRGESNV